MIQRC